MTEVEMHEDEQCDHQEVPRPVAWVYSAAVAVPGAALLIHAVWHVIAIAFGLPCP